MSEEFVIFNLREAAQFFNRPWESLRKFVTDAKKRGEIKVVTRGHYKTEYFKLSELAAIDADRPRKTRLR